MDLYLFFNWGGGGFSLIFLNNFDQFCNLTTYILAVYFFRTHSVSSSTHHRIPGMNHYRLRYLSQNHAFITHSYLYHDMQGSNIYIC